MKAGTIVIVDEEARQRETLAAVLEERGHIVRIAGGGAQAIEAVRKEPIDIVLTDLRMPDVSGLDVLRKVREIQPEVAVVVLTAYGTVGGAVDAMKSGAADYLTKPVDLDELDLVVARILERRDLVRENRVLRERLEESATGFRLLGSSPGLREVLVRAGRAAETDATVLIRGESGTGKELLARSIHSLGGRADGPFVAVNCAALPEALLESELFGHEPGSFTGATSRHRGRVERAEGGTLFLDEIGDVAPAAQVKLLRFLQDHEFSPVGSEKALRGDVRVMAATHRDLEEMARVDEFREDLYYRLNVVSLTLPSLRERRSDIPELAEHFLTRFAKRYDRNVARISREALDALIKYEFPGNVRELENIIEQATVLVRDDVITLADLPRAVREGGGSRGVDTLTPETVTGDLPRLLEDIERRIVTETIARHAGNQSSAARHLGLTESGLRYKLKRWEES
ncbi:sigma-54 dependent transcriptional regulator [bacterium]|nr:sigma-54 dependent transcriptional regulator [bacterium]